MRASIRERLLARARRLAHASHTATMVELGIGLPIVGVALAFSIASGVYRARAIADANEAARAIDRCPP